MSRVLEYIWIWLPSLVILTLIGTIVVAPPNAFAIIAALLALPAILFLGATVITRYQVALVGLAFVLFSRTVDVLSQNFGVPAVGYVLLIALLTALILRFGLEFFQMPPARVWQPIVIFVLVILATTIVADDPEISIAYVVELAKNLVFVSAILLAIRCFTDLKLLTGAMVVAGTIPATIGVFQAVSGSRQEFFGYGTFLDQPLVYDSASLVARPGGPVGDPNFFAMTLVPLIPLAIYLGRDTHSTLTKLAAAAAVMLLIAGTLVTFSRGGLFALAAIGLVLAFFGILRWRTLILISLVLIISLPFLPDNYAGRIEAGSSALTDEGAAEEDPAVSGRLSEMVAGVRMLTDHPLLGVGIGNYQLHYQEYARPLGIERRTPRAAHSLPIETLAETGVIGFAALAILIGVPMFGLRAIWRAPGIDPQMRLASQGYFTAICGLLAASVFLHDAYPRYLWLLLAGCFGLILLRDHNLVLHPTSDQSHQGWPDPRMPRAVATR